MTEQECYLCGQKASATPEGKLTRDHLPPKNLFLPPRPSDLITLPCCNACNNQAHEDDEYLRLAVSGYLNNNPIGKRIWREKAVGSTIRKRRLRKPVDAMAASLKRIALITPEGVEDAVEVEIKRAPIDRALTRMTKGFLALLHPEIDRTLLTFRTTQLDQFKLNDPGFGEIRKVLSYFQRGNGVYRCWYGLDAEYSLKGGWIHMFFDSAAYLVEHTSDRRIVMPW